MAQKRHTSPQKAITKRMQRQQTKTSKSFNCQLPMIIGFCGLLTCVTFVMRRSSVRLRLWAKPLNPSRLISCRGFLFLSKVDFISNWHTSGTLIRNNRQHKQSKNLPPPLRFFRLFMISKSDQQIFKCATSVPFRDYADNTSREISILCRHNFALLMRCCLFSALPVCFCKFYKERMK